MGQHFSANTSEVLDALYRRLLNLFQVGFGGLFSYVVFCLLEMRRGGNHEMMLDRTSGGYLNLLHKVRFAMRSDELAHGLNLSAIESFQGLKLLNFFQQPVPLLL